MPFPSPTVSDLIGQMSPRAMSAAFNLIGFHWDKKLSDISTVGVLAMPTIQFRLAAQITLTDGFEGGEVMDFALRYLSEDGVEVEVSTAQLNETLTPVAGVFTALVDVPEVPVGSVLQIIRTYTPGMGPKDTPMSLVLRFL